MNEPKFFVCCDHDTPVCIKFTEEEARALGTNYVDAFDEFGEKVRSYEFKGTVIKNGKEHPQYIVTEWSK